MRVLFLNPPFLPRYSRSQRSPGVIRSGTLYYPIWPAYATGMVEREGFETKLVDCPATGMDNEAVFRLMRSWEPQLVFIDTSTPSAESDLALAQSMQRQFPETWVFPVGTHVTATYEETLRTYPDLRGVCLGEYDETVVDLCRRKERGEEAIGVPGTAIVNRSLPRPSLGKSDSDTEGADLAAQPRDKIKDLDSLPWVSQVYKRHLRIEDYFYSITRHPVVTIITGRGCPFHCLFCLYPQVMHGHQYRTRSPQSVASEFEYIRRDIPSVREVFIEDDTFTANKERTWAICEELIRSGNRLPWTANSRTDVDLETLSLMKRAGCRLLCVGFESADNGVLKGMRKGQNSDRGIRFREDARRAGIMIHGCFLLGGPGETRESLENTFQYAKRLSCDTAQFFPIMVYPGTAAYQWAKENNYLHASGYRDWLTETGQHRCLIDTPELSAKELMQFCDEARRRYYLAPRYCLRMLQTLICHPGEAKRVFMAFRRFARHLF
ncbi:MAG TPA: radical SAM protein [bacterium]|nr:radical SAM protein [bacterium]HQL61950.1 radical SAM protein [bacterium]